MIAPEYFDVVIAGGGIAGLSVSEIFARSGFHVALIEQAPRLCYDASRKQHGWFHLGGLYCVNRDALHLRTMVENIDHLLTYYRDFEGMNLRIRRHDGHLTTGFGDHNTSSWFNGDNSRFHYLIQRNVSRSEAASFHKYHGIDWPTAVRLFNARHNRFRKCDWRRGSAPYYIPNANLNDDPSPEERGLLSTPDWADRLGSLRLALANFDCVLGHDRSMNVRKIIGDLAKSFQFHGGTVMTNTKVVRYEQVGRHIKVSAQSGTGALELRAGKLIQAMGRGLGTGIVQQAYFRAVNTLASALLIVNPPLCQANFQILSPQQNRCINHIVHRRSGHAYSLIGDNGSADPALQHDVDEIQRALEVRARETFSNLDNGRIVKPYICYKTELAEPELQSSESGRNYSFVLRKVDNNVYVTIPGKLSLAFTLAINTYQELVGNSPNPALDPAYEKENVDQYLSELYHAEVIDDMHRQQNRYSAPQQTANRVGGASARGANGDREGSFLGPRQAVEGLDV